LIALIKKHEEKFGDEVDQRNINLSLVNIDAEAMFKVDIYCSLVRCREEIEAINGTVKRLEKHIKEDLRTLDNVVSVPSQFSTKEWKPLIRKKQLMLLEILDNLAGRFPALLVSDSNPFGAFHS
jgi:hypothetical protein